MALLAITIIIKKNGRFPNTHVSGTKALRKRGIKCAQSQDRDARKENHMAIEEIRKKQSRIIYIMKTIGKLTIIAATAASLFTFTQCTNNAPTTATETEAVKSEATGIRVAYVNLDTLMNMYNLAQDINKEMMRKEENIKMTLTEKAKALQADQADFERKYKNNVYATQERAQQEYNRIMKKEQDIVKLEQSLYAEYEKEGLEKNIALRDSINKFIVEYNNEKGYDYILTRIGDNILFANEAYNITQEVVDGLNKKYKSVVE